MTDFWEASNEPDDPLKVDLIQMIRDRYRATPRHLQVELGPSEVGHPCMRKMAFGLMQVPRCNPEFDPLPSITGTALHTWVQSAAEHANNVLGRERWLTETRVNVATGLSGSSDLYDRDTGTVIDWKFPGNNRITKYAKDIGPVFRNQVHLYGLGFENAGLPVKRVAVMLVPRGKTLHSSVLWQEDYDRARAEAVLRRREAVIRLIDDLQVETNPAHYEWIPIEPYDCLFCDWFSVNPKNAMQCKGDQ